MALNGLGAVAEIAVNDLGADAAVQTGELELRRLFSVGGAPFELAISNSGNLLFVADSAAPEVARIDLGSGAVDRRNIGGLGGPMAVSQDDTLLVVGRPALRDLVVLENADGPSFALYDTNPPWVPLPTCVAPCDEPDHCPAGTHPADTAVCLAASAEILEVGDPYGAVFLNAAPMEIATLAAGRGDDGVLTHPLPEPACGTETPGEYSQYAVVATLDGMLWFLTLRNADDLLEVGLLNESWCSEPEVEIEDAAGMPDFALGDLLATCPAVPDRQRFVCVEERVVLMPGATGVKNIQITWEDVIVDRTTGGGEVTASGGFKDVGLDLGLEAIRPNDILEIRTAASLDGSCTDVIGTGTQLCDLERRIIEIQTADEADTVLVLDDPLEPACFGGGGGIGYRIRAGDQFRVVPGISGTDGTFTEDGRQERIAPGEWLGRFGERGRDHRLTLGILDSLDPRGNESACERYDVTNGLAAPMVRDAPIWLRVDDNYDPIEFDPFILGSTSPTGYRPSAILVETIGEGLDALQVVYVAYSGSGSSRLFTDPPLEGILGFAPELLDDEELMQVLKID